MIARPRPIEAFTPSFVAIALHSPPDR
jgi:hypothetical protein